MHQSYKINGFTANPQVSYTKYNNYNTKIPVPLTLFSVTPEICRAADLLFPSKRITFAA